MTPACVDATDALLLRRLHSDFPLCESPYAEVASDLGLSEAEVLQRLQRLLECGLVSRVGPLFELGTAGGTLILAAMQVPEERFDSVAEVVNALPEVAHNYRREHRFNMWFAFDCASRPQMREVCDRVEVLTGLRVYVFPKEKEFFTETRLPADPAEAMRC